VHGVAYAAPGVGNVACVAGDQVHVQVEDGLAGCGSDVDAYVVAVGLAGGFHGLAGNGKGGQEFGLFIRGGIEPG
jgi:hypothetical protein